MWFPDSVGLRLPKYNKANQPSAILKLLKSLANRRNEEEALFCQVPFQPSSRPMHLQHNPTEHLAKVFRAEEACEPRVTVTVLSAAFSQSTFVGRSSATNRQSLNRTA
uniref:Uncharacterized protein n=1 Tax=Anguilla anguilla TaxID=7936 RepID=A0A0E9XRN5_ANGAN